ncbi:16278_t:CDS:2 [Funneliformis caledonium]|uniref:16278_t:CDS:1 n=1 Tax=Funneliformis caledonium TaxID=1117310 RepID=A0A9N9DTS1_9GLOM|nr:16278_t:CDS:2 [Funneliformis caledonium]
MPRMLKSESKKKRNIKWVINCDNPTSLVKLTHHKRADEKYRNTLNSAFECNPKNREIKKHRNAKKDGKYKQDWKIWMQEK